MKKLSAKRRPKEPRWGEISSPVDGAQQQRLRHIMRPDKATKGSLHEEPLTIFGSQQVLPSELRTFFEPRLGHSLADVQLHNNEKAVHMAHALKARAFTLGQNIVFGQGEFNPQQPAGMHLLAHELAHTVQQRHGSVWLQRTPIEKKGFSIPEFEFSKGRQEATGKSGDAFVDLSYDPDTSIFLCTFQMKWRSFPKTWTAKQRESYKQRFMKLIKKTWARKYTLIEYESSAPKAKATGRTAQVDLDFFEPKTPTFKTGKEEVEWYMNMPVKKRQRLGQRYILDVHEKRVRESVFGDSLITLDPASLSSERQSLERYRKLVKPKVYTQEYLDNPYYKAGIKLKVPSAKAYKQTPAVHEFGHMIGLADEYVISKEDYDEMVKKKGAKYAQKQLEKRKTVTGRVMNIGSAIRPDHYRPFALWLSKLTGKHWRVSGDKGR